MEKITRYSQGEVTIEVGEDTLVISSGVGQAMFEAAELSDLTELIQAVAADLQSVELVQTHTLRTGVYRDKGSHDYKIKVYPRAEDEKYTVVYMDGDTTTLRKSTIETYYEYEEAI